MRKVSLLAASLVATILSVCQPALAEPWRIYRDPQLRFEVELPTQTFQVAESTSRHLALREVDGDATIDIYTGVNAKGLSPQAFAGEVSHAGDVGDITYRSSGPTWFAISGHYQSANIGEAPIYYAKYLFSPNLQRIAGFEISYSAKEKVRMSHFVERIETTFRTVD